MKKKTATRTTVRRKASKAATSASRQSWTPALLASKKGVSPKAARAFLRRHYDSPKSGEGWVVTAKMAEAFLAA